MTTTHECQECGTAVPANVAVLRGTIHGQLAWHRACWETLHGPLVPQPRGPLSVEVAKAVDAGVAEAEAYANRAAS